VGRLEFIWGFAGAKCNLTLEGSVHSATLTKTVGLLIGYITRASIGPCPTGSATLLTATFGAGGSVTSVTLGGTVNCEGIGVAVRGTTSSNSAIIITLI